MDGCLSWDLPHPPDKVWRALAEPELVAQWLLQTDLKLEDEQSFGFSCRKPYTLKADST